MYEALFSIKVFKETFSLKKIKKWDVNVMPILAKVEFFYHVSENYKKEHKNIDKFNPSLREQFSQINTSDLRSERKKRNKVYTELHGKWFWST